MCTSETVRESAPKTPEELAEEYLDKAFSIMISPADYGMSETFPVLIAELSSDTPGHTDTYDLISAGIKEFPELTGALVISDESADQTGTRTIVASDLHECRLREQLFDMEIGGEFVYQTRVLFIDSGA